MSYTRLQPRTQEQRGYYRIFIPLKESSTLSVSSPPVTITCQGPKWYPYFLRLITHLNTNPPPPPIISNIFLNSLDEQRSYYLMLIPICSPGSTSRSRRWSPWGSRVALDVDVMLITDGNYTRFRGNQRIKHNCTLGISTERSLKPPASSTISVDQRRCLEPTRAWALTRHPPPPCLPLWPP